MKLLFEHWRRYLEESNFPTTGSQEDTEKIKRFLKKQKRDSPSLPPAPEKIDIETEEEEEDLEEGCGGNVTNLLDDPDGTGHATWRNKKGVASITILDEK